MKRRPSSQSGFTLIEVLVAVLVVSVGVLGVAGMQLVSLQNNTSALFRTQAIQSAYDIMDRARLNRLEDYSLAMDDDTPVAPNCVVQSCNPAEMRSFDLAFWREALADNLPEGNGAVVMDEGKLSVTVQWQDSRDPDADLMEITSTSLLTQ